MKRIIAIAIFTALSASVYAFAHGGDGSGGGMSGCGGMMKNPGAGMMGGAGPGMMDGGGQGMMGGGGMTGGMGGAEMQERCANMMRTDNESSASGKAASASGAIHGSGIVRGIDRAGRKVTLQHGPIPAIGWPAMTMTFAVDDATALSKLAPGQNVDFDLAKRGGDYVVTSIR